MAVYNYLNTDARVQRAANALKDKFDLTLVGIEDSYENDGLTLVKLPLRGKTHSLRYYNFCKDLIKYARTHKFDLYYFHDLYMAYPLLRLKKLQKSIPNIYDCHETIFPQKGVRFSLRDYFFYHFDRKATIKADYVVCAQIDRGKIIQERYNLKTLPTIVNNISILYDNCIKLDEQLQHKLDLFFESSLFSVVYAGGINEDRNLSPLIDAIKNTSYSLLLIGYGNAYSKIEQKIKDENISNCLLLGKVPYKCLGQIIKKCNCGYVSYGTFDVNNKYCASNKVYEYCSVNVPILATYNPTIEKVVNNYSIGVCSDDISLALDNLHKNYETYRQNTFVFNQDNRWEEDEKRLQQLVENVLKQQK